MCSWGSSSGWRVVKLGGNLNNGSKAGFAYLNVNNDSTNDNANISSQLANYVKKMIKRFTYHSLASWQNTKQSSRRVGKPGLKARRVT